MSKIRITELDHIVLNVRDVDKSLVFYTQVLGLKGERIQEFRKGEVGFPSVRINEHTIIDLSPSKKDASGEAALKGNLNHFCMVVEREDFSGLVDYLTSHGVEVLQGPVSRWGAKGRATSLYLLDPDRNEVEIRHY
jgi:catechol 2,3-dioxygenase-like lactoylglutathione lyase family enzyme